jgi:hypothetical protein
MSPDFPKRSDRKILERIIPPPLGGRDKLHFIRFTTALCAWYNSTGKFQYTSFLTLGSHYQRVSLKVDLPGLIPSKLSKIHILFSSTNQFQILKLVGRTIPHSGVLKATWY